jgi:hypothetical protein
MTGMLSNMDDGEDGEEDRKSMSESDGKNEQVLFSTSLVVNFTNILRVAFLLRKFCGQVLLYLHFWFVLFWHKKISAKA